MNCAGYVGGRGGGCCLLETGGLAGANPALGGEEGGIAAGEGETVMVGTGGGFLSGGLSVFLDLGD